MDSCRTCSRRIHVFQQLSKEAKRRHTLQCYKRIMSKIIWKLGCRRVARAFVCVWLVVGRIGVIMQTRPQLTAFHPSLAVAVYKGFRYQVVLHCDPGSQRWLGMVIVFAKIITTPRNARPSGTSTETGSFVSLAARVYLTAVSSSALVQTQ